MSGLVQCPVCGWDNARENVEKYRMCSHCGAQMDAGPEYPAGAAAPPGQAPYGTPPPPVAGAPPPPQPQQPQPQPQLGAPPLYGAPPPYGAYPPQQSYPPPPYGQPYPPPYPPQYPPPYGYGAPYGQPWPPTFHPGAYDRPEEPPRLDIGGWLRMLFKPKEAFESMWPHTKAIHGMVIAIVMVVIGAIVGFAISNAVLSGLDVPNDTGVPLSSVRAASAMTLASGIVTGLLTYFLMAYFTFALLKSVGHARRPDLERTLGFFGYARLPGFLIGMATSGLGAMMLASVDWNNINNTASDPTGWIGQMCGLLLVIVVLAIISLVWSLWIYGHAAAVANDVSFGTGIGFTILAYIIAALISAVVSSAFSVGTFMGT